MFCFVNVIVKRPFLILNALFIFVHSTGDHNVDTNMHPRRYEESMRQTTEAIGLSEQAPKCTDMEIEISKMTYYCGIAWTRVRIFDRDLRQNSTSSGIKTTTFFSNTNSNTTLVMVTVNLLHFCCSPFYWDSNSIQQR